MAAFKFLNAIFYLKLREYLSFLLGSHPLRKGDYKQVDIDNLIHAKIHQI